MATTSDINDAFDSLLLCENQLVSEGFQAVLRIHDILVWIRMRIRILLFSSLTFKMPTKN
jgi:hypothetical protein